MLVQGWMSFPGCTVKELPSFFSYKVVVRTVKSFLSTRRVESYPANPDVTGITRRRILWRAACRPERWIELPEATHTVRSFVVGTRRVRATPRNCDEFSEDSSSSSSFSRKYRFNTWQTAPDSRLSFYCRSDRADWVLSTKPIGPIWRVRNLQNQEINATTSIRRYL